MIARITHAFQLVAMLGVLVMLTAFPAAAHDSQASVRHAAQDVTVLDDPASCIVGVTPEMFGSAAPSETEGRSLVSVRLTFAPGASIGAHIHPGTLIATVDSGSLAFTLISDGEMDINRAPAADGSRATDVALPGEELVLTAGDGFVESGMVHSARNAADGETVVIISGFVEEGQPLTQCVEE